MKKSEYKPLKYKKLTEYKEADINACLRRMANERIFGTRTDTISMEELKLLQMFCTAQLETFEAALMQGASPQVVLANTIGMSFLMGFYIGQVMEEESKLVEKVN